MSRTRISTTVDDGLLAEARERRPGLTDAKLVDEALTALLARERAAEIDARYREAYGRAPLDETDEWGDLAAWREAAGST